MLHHSKCKFDTRDNAAATEYSVLVLHGPIPLAGSDILIDFADIRQMYEAK